MQPAPNSYQLPERMKRPGVRPMPGRRSLMVPAAWLHVAGYGFWVPVCFFFDPYCSAWWEWLVLASLVLALFCPVAAVFRALVSIVLGDARRRNGAVLALTLLLPFGYQLLADLVALVCS